MYSNKEIITLQAGALVNLCELLTLTGLDYPKLKISHQKFLEFFAKSQGFQTFKGASESKTPLSFDHNTCLEEYPKLLRNPQKEELGELSKTWHILSNFLKAPYEKIELYTLLKSIDLSLYGEFSYEAKNILDRHARMLVIGQPQLTQLYLFCHFVSTLGKGSELNQIRPFKNKEKLAELNRMAVKVYDSLLVTTNNGQELYFKPQAYKILLKEYGAQPNLQTEGHPSYLSLVQTLGHATSSAESALDIELRNISKEYLSIFDKYKLEKIDSAVEKELLIADLNRASTPGLYALKPDLFEHPPFFPSKRNEFVADIAQMYTSELSLLGLSSTDYEIYLNGAGFVKIKADQIIDELAQKKTGLNLEEWSICWLLKDIGVKSILASEEDSDYGFVQDYKKFLVTVILKLLDARGIDDSSNFGKQILRNLENIRKL